MHTYYKEFNQLKTVEDHLKFLFSPHGSSNRKMFWIGNLYVFGFLLAYGLGVGILFSLTDRNIETFDVFLFPYMILLSFINLYLSGVLCLRRIRKKNESPWFLILLLIPYASFLWMYIYLGLFKDNDEKNVQISDSIETEKTEIKSEEKIKFE